MQAKINLFFPFFFYLSRQIEKENAQNKNEGKYINDSL